MATVHSITPEVRAIEAPDELKLLPTWLCWRFEQHPGETKPRKVPLYSSGGRRHGAQGSPADRAKLTTFAAARDAAARQGFDGVGLALLPETGLVVLDFDNCVGPDGELPPEVAQIAERSFAEYSPSGTGVHVFLRGNLGNHKSLGPEHPYGFEAFSTNGFITVSGNPLPHVDILGYENHISEVDAPLEAFCQRRFFGKRNAPNDGDDFTAGFESRLNIDYDQVLAAVYALDPSMGRESWLVVGMALHHQLGEDGFDIWHEWSEGAHNYSGEESMRYQWDKFHEDGSGRRRVTMASVIKMINDLREAERQPVTAQDLQQAADDPEPYDGKFRPVRASQMSSRPPDWLIKGVLPKTVDPVIIFGPSGSGKSFLAIQYAACIAQGEPWRGHKTTKGRVLYVAAEGSGGVRKRIDAYCRHNGIDIDTLDIDVLTAQPNILDADDIKEIVRMHTAFGPYVAIIIDTFAQVTPGANENAGEDMGLALANVKAVQRATRTTAILIHHAGKDVSRGSRGWSGIKAAAEAQIEVTRDEVTGERAIRIEKMKDGEDGKRYGFALETVTLAMDDDGDMVTSCVLVDAEVCERAAETPRGAGRGVKVRGEHATHLVEIAATLDIAGDSISVSEFIAAALDALPVPEGRDTRRQNLMRALERLSREKDGPLAVAGGRVIFYA